MVRLGFVGDVYPGPAGGLEMETAVLERLGDVDLLVANLEGPLTASVDDPLTKRTRLRSAPDTANLLGSMGIGLVSLANNHMFDFGAAGFHDSVTALERAGISWVGAGVDTASARRPVIHEIAGTRLGFLAYSARAIETVVATDDAPGCAPLDFDEIEADLRALGDAVDHSIVILHWGLTGYELPTPEDHSVGRKLVEAGAALVIGAHPHVAQGVVGFGSGLVAFSLGDFAFYPESADGRPVNQYRERQTGVFLTVGLSLEGPTTHDVVLTRQQGRRISLEEQPRRRGILERNSKKLRQSPVRYPTLWRRYVFRRTASRIVKRLAPWRWKTIRAGAFSGLGVAIREMLRRHR